MRTLIGRVLAVVSKENDDEAVIRLAQYGGRVFAVRVGTDAIALAPSFSRGSVALIRGYYEGLNGFNAVSLEIISERAA